MNKKVNSIIFQQIRKLKNIIYDIESNNELNLRDLRKELDEIKKQVSHNGNRFEKSIKREEEHYEEYKYFEKRTMDFQEEFPYDCLNWLGKLMFWLMCKKRKKK